jgi:hypothetical protein
MFFFGNRGGPGSPLIPDPARAKIGNQARRPRDSKIPADFGRITEESEPRGRRAGASDFRVWPGGANLK